MPVDRDEVFAIFPRGVILPWYAQAGPFPPGWTVCDGSNGTPDLRGKFLLGVSDMADVGQARGAARHGHTIEGGVNTARASNTTDGWGFDTDADRNRSPSVTGIDHSHSHNISVREAEHLPPCVTVLYMMKL